MEQQQEGSKGIIKQAKEKKAVSLEQGEVIRRKQFMASLKFLKDFGIYKVHSGGQVMQVSNGIIQVKDKDGNINEQEIENIKMVANPRDLHLVGFDVNFNDIQEVFAERPEFEKSKLIKIIVMTKEEEYGGFITMLPENIKIFKLAGCNMHPENEASVWTRMLYDQAMIKVQSEYPDISLEESSLFF